MKKQHKEKLRQLAIKLKTKNAPIQEWIKNGLIPKEETSPIKMVAGNEKLFSKVADHTGDIMQWVGFAWVNEGLGVLFKDAKLIDTETNNIIPIIY